MFMYASDVFIFMYASNVFIRLVSATIKSQTAPVLALV